MSRLYVMFRLWRARRKGLHSYLKESEATLYITKKDYAYLEVDGVRYYFHNSNPRVVRYRQVETFDGKSYKQSIVPYDGYGVFTQPPITKAQGENQ